jgi:hypothetical protein
VALGCDADSLGFNRLHNGVKVQLPFQPHMCS